MHIISYLDVNTTSTAFKADKSSSFKKSKTQVVSTLQAKKQSFDLAKSINNKKIFNIEKILKILFVLPKVLYILRFYLLTLASFLCIVSIIANLTTVQTSQIRNLSLDTAREKEMLSLDIAMADFALPKREYFDREGNLGTSASIASLVTKPVNFQNYTVKAGDTISGIAKRFGLSNISTLIAINNISNVRSLRSGQKIRIPSIDGLTHSVKQGESLSGIAKKYNVSLVNLLDVNDLSSEIVQKGDLLFIPGAKMDAMALSEALGELFKDPLGVPWRLTSNYGYRADPFTGVKSFHTGIDMAAPLGTNIKASMAGTIAAASYNQVYGNYVIISHSGGYQTLYAHMATISVKLGQKVNQGTVVGKLGSTGYSTGPHLHFTVYKNGQLIDPFTVLK